MLRRAAQGPEAKWRSNANYGLGHLSEKGLLGHVTKDRVAALEFFRKAEADGDKSAPQRIRYLMNFPDVFIELNKSEFLAQANDSSPGSLQRAAELIGRKDYANALPIYIFHSRGGNTDAQLVLAVMYGDGRGVAADQRRAAAWYFMAAIKGHRMAQRELARALYLNRNLVDEDEETRYWLTQAAEQHDVEALRLLGLLALNPLNKNARPNLRVALSHWESAASQGSAHAMTNLGDLYMGRLGDFGLPRDTLRARAYYIAAADQGDAEARGNLFREFNITHNGKPGSAGQVPITPSPQPAPPTQPTTMTPATPANPPVAGAALSKPSLVELFAMLSPSVVRIVTLNIDGKKNEFTGLGSAVVIRPDLVLTNCHVLDDSNAVGTVIDRQVLLFDVIGGDTNRDLCLMRPEKPLRNVQKTRSFRSLRIGERVFAIGSPLGLENTLSEGIISGLRTDEGIRYIQTSAAVSPGSSGGGLFDENGALIGITTFKAAGENLNFAVAIDESERVIAHFLK